MGCGGSSEQVRVGVAGDNANSSGQGQQQKRQQEHERLQNQQTKTTHVGGRNTLNDDSDDDDNEDDSKYKKLNPVSGGGAGAAKTYAKPSLNALQQQQQQQPNKPMFQEINLKYTDDAQQPQPQQQQRPHSNTSLNLNSGNTTSRRFVLDEAITERSEYGEKSERMKSARGGGGDRSERMKSARDMRAKTPLAYNQNEANIQQSQLSQRLSQNFSQNDLEPGSSRPAPSNISNKNAVAFTIGLEDENTNSTNSMNNYDSILRRPPPLSKFKLEPINTKPKLTQEQIEEKMRAVEAKREEVLAKRIKSSRERTERRESIHQKQQNEHDANLHKIEHSINSASKNREEQIEERIEKQRRQEERRRRVMRAYRERTTEELEYQRNNDFEGDKYFNDDDEDF